MTVLGEVKHSPTTIQSWATICLNKRITINDQTVAVQPLGHTPTIYPSRIFNELANTLVPE